MSAQELLAARAEIALLKVQRDEARERLAQLRHDVLLAWRTAGPKPKPPKLCPARSKTQGRCDQPGGHTGMHSVKGEGFGLGGVS